MTWSPTQPAGTNLMLVIRDVDSGETVERLEGPSPLKIVLGEDTAGAALAAVAFAAGGSVTVNQPFTVLVSTFEGAGPAADYTAVGA